LHLVSSINVVNTKGAQPVSVVSTISLDGFKVKMVKIKS
jgi:hypothetical protein